MGKHRAPRGPRLALAVLVAVNAALWPATITAWARHENSPGRVMFRVSLR